MGGRARTAELRTLPFAACTGAKRRKQATTWGAGARARRPLRSGSSPPNDNRTQVAPVDGWLAPNRMLGGGAARSALGLPLNPSGLQSASTYAHGPASGDADKDWPLDLSRATPRRGRHGRQHRLSARSSNMRNHSGMADAAFESRTLGALRIARRRTAPFII